MNPQRRIENRRKLESHEALHTAIDIAVQYPGGQLDLEVDDGAYYAHMPQELTGDEKRKMLIAGWEDAGDYWRRDY